MTMVEPTEGITPTQKPVAVPVTQCVGVNHSTAVAEGRIQEIKHLTVRSIKGSHYWVGKHYIVVNVTKTVKRQLLPHHDPSFEYF
jgi:hypothetical protein